MYEIHFSYIGRGECDTDFFFVNWAESSGKAAESQICYLDTCRDLTENVKPLESGWTQPKLGRHDIIHHINEACQQ
jgi:hypothetical protein